MKPTNKKVKNYDSEKFNIMEYIPYRISTITTRSVDLLASQYKVFDISRPQFRVLAYVSAFPHASSAHVVLNTQMDKSRVARAIDNLVERKLLLRETNPDDKRTNLLLLSSDGEALFRKISPLAMKIQRRFSTSLTKEEQRALNNILIKMDGALNQLEAENEANNSA